MIEEYELIISLFAALIAMTISMIYLSTIKKVSKKKSFESEKIIYELKEVAGLNLSEKSQNRKSSSNAEYKYYAKLDELIKNHHEQALSQAKIQFWFSLIAAVAGFIVIICIYIFFPNAVWYEYIVKMLPGGIIEAVSLLFFTQSRETRERASDFLNRLRIDRQYEKAIIIVDTIKDEHLKDELKGEISLHLCEIKNTDLGLIKKAHEDSGGNNAVST